MLHSDLSSRRRGRIHAAYQGADTLVAAKKSVFACLFFMILNRATKVKWLDLAWDREEDRHTGDVSFSEFPFVWRMPVEHPEPMLLVRPGSTETGHGSKPVMRAGNCRPRGAVIEPIAKSAGTPGSRAVETVRTAVILADLDHTTSDHSIADDANPPVVK